MCREIQHADSLQVIQCLLTVLAQLNSVVSLSKET